MNIIPNYVPNEQAVLYFSVQLFSLLKMFVNKRKLQMQIGIYFCFFYLFVPSSVILKQPTVTMLKIYQHFRYCAVCHPYTYRDLTQARSVSKRVTLYVIPVVIFSIILNLPKFFETQIVFNSGQHHVDFSMFKNGSIDNIEAIKKLLEKGENTISYEMTSLRNNPDYIR